MKNRLRVLRAEFRLSQADLAERLGVARQTIHAVENDKFAPSLTLAFKIASLFGTDINDVFAPDPEDTVPSLLESQHETGSTPVPADDRAVRPRPLIFFGKPRPDGER
ncbi:MAG: helix-turn-helix transcriptional regulator [Candidatus Eremiobacteraeota bacterium]|nr:helix-turn-helix transcriptional regulator [Candidatus Eremiobacteraeota bacterium]